MFTWRMSLSCHRCKPGCKTQGACAAKASRQSTAAGSLQLTRIFLYFRNLNSGQWSYIWNNQRGPKKPAPSDKFIAIFQVAQNPLKFAMQTLILWQNVPFFFTSGETRLQTRSTSPSSPPYLTPPPPSSNGVHHTCTMHSVWLSRIEILHGLEMDRGGRGGWIFCAILSIFFCLKWKTIHTGTFFNTKRVNMANFSGFSATWKIATNLSLGASSFGVIQLLIIQEKMVD